jgi:hypothetical protein
MSLPARTHLSKNPTSVLAPYEIMATRDVYVERDTDPQPTCHLGLLPVCGPIVFV